MKLVLANNQSSKFVEFYRDLKAASGDAFEYASYEELLFAFDPDAGERKIEVHHLGTGKELREYDGVYLNGYLSTYELAATMATCCQALNMPFVNRELADAPSLSKLTSYAKLARADVRMPKTVAGTKRALLAADSYIDRLTFPLVLKRADADRGIDNYKVADRGEIAELLQNHETRSLWILQEFVPNDGFYLVSFYDQQPVFSIFRSLGERPDHNERKAHMFKPKGGANAALVPLPDVPAAVMDVSQRAINAMNRQIGSVDVLYDPASDRAFVLEVNYNPQLATIETFKEPRIQAFIEGINKIH